MATMKTRPFWKDPVVVVGAAVPTLILVVFFAYLAMERSARTIPEVPVVAILRRDEPAPLAADPAAMTVETERLLFWKAFDAWGAAVERLESDPSLPNLDAEKEKKREYEETMTGILSLYRPLLEEAAPFFTDSEFEIGQEAFSTREQLLKAGLRADLAEILKGGIFLSRNTHYPDRGKPGSPHEMPNFRYYCFLYEQWRKEGLSHERVIEKMYTLRKM